MDSCYNPGTGDLNTNQTACGDPSSGAQSCCLDEDICMGDSICLFNNRQFDETSSFYIGGCNERNFPSPECSAYCGRSRSLSWSITNRLNLAPA